jgi:hypothetical protein
VRDAQPGPEDLLLTALLAEPLQQALDALPPEFRLAVMLCDVEGLPYEEAARAAGCPVGTIRSRLHRGRARLRRQVGPSLRVLYGAGARGSAPGVRPGGRSPSRAQPSREGNEAAAQGQEDGVGRVPRP